MNPLEQQPYNMPAIEHNGEQWIRLVDHIHLTEATHQAAIEECVRVAEGMKHKGFIDGLEEGRWVKAYETALTDLITALTPTT
jgi:hypothetical protein